MKDPTYAEVIKAIDEYQPGRRTQGEILYGYYYPGRLGKIVICIRPTREEATFSFASVMNRAIDRGYRVADRIAHLERYELVKIERLPANDAVPAPSDYPALGHLP